MRRRLVHLLTALSLLLCAAAFVLWVRSYIRLDVVGRTSMWPEGANWYWRNWHFRSADGGLRLMSDGFLINSPTFADQWAQEVGQGYWRAYEPGEMGPREPFPGNLWFDFWSQRRGSDRPGPEVIYSDRLNVRVPYWLPVLLTATAPLFLFLRRRRNRSRVRDNLCSACGYDLRATPTLCPECGQVPTPSTTP